MANFTAADVKALRERTGAGMVDVKNALVEAEGDAEKAIEILRVKGLKGVAKREGRTTTNGLVAAKVDGTKGYLIELACETDFVAKNERFVKLADDVLDAIAALGAADLDAANAAPAGDTTVSDLIVDQSAVLGEKLELRRIEQLEADRFAVYLHKTNQDLPPQVGVLLAYEGDDSETAHQVAQHIAAAAPQYLTIDDVPEDVVANERRVAEEVTRAEGKPEKAIEKIVQGRVHGFFKTIVLLEQDYVRDNKLSVKKVLEDADVAVKGFARFRVGEQA